jgi:EmrB/QacA subfamily drug resistance transporter
MTQMMLARAAGRHLARVMGFVAIPVLIAPLLGPVVAGVILKFLGWPWLFYINVPIGILAVSLAALLLPADEPQGSRRFDFLGFLLISPGLISLLYGLDRASSREGEFFLLFGALLMAVFVWHATRKGAEALIDLKLFKNRVFSISAITQFLNNGASYAAQMLIPLFLITGSGISAAQAGWMLAPSGIGMMIIYPSLGWLTDKFGCRAVAVSGAFLVVLCTLPLLWMAQYQFSPILLAITLFVRGIGQGAIGVPSISAAYISVPKEQLALATAASNIVQRLGGPIATTVIGIVLSLPTNRLSASGAHTFVMPFVVLIGLQVVLLSSTARLPIRIHSNSPHGPN